MAEEILSAMVEQTYKLKCEIMWMRANLLPILVIFYMTFFTKTSKRKKTHQASLCEGDLREGMVSKIY